jgi:hypothetical protein
MVVESFGSRVEFGGIAFSSVKIFHPRKGPSYKFLEIVNDIHPDALNRMPWYDLSGGSSLRRCARNTTP